jgi:chemotaxis protein MotB
MKARKKRKHEEEQENGERWLVSYADFITLLFAFFVTMYAISRVDGKKLGSAVESLQRALGSVISVQNSQRNPGVFSASLPRPVHITPMNGDKGPLSKEEIEKFEKLTREIQSKMQGLYPQTGGPAGERARGNIGRGETAPGNIGKGDIAKGSTGSGEQIKFIIEKRGLVIRVSDRLFFESGDASIRPDFIPMLDLLAGSFESIQNHIRIEGHTDSVPINTARFPSNWELSTARATTIIRYLSNFHINKERLSATGYGEFHPVESNRSAQGRLQNRRVDFVVLSNREMEDEPASSPTETDGQETGAPGPI